MSVDLRPYLHPHRSAVVVFECQQMVLGPAAPYAGLAEAARAGMLRHLPGLLDAARAAGVVVVYCTVSGRPGGLGAAKVPLLDRRAAAHDHAATADGAGPDRSIVPEVAPRDGDVIVDRTHGMSAFHGTELDTCLRALGVETVVPTGVSANIGVVGTAIEAINHGYRLVIPTDCIAADPPEYGEQMMRFTFRNLGYLTTAAAVAAIWRGNERAPVDTPDSA